MIATMYGKDEVELMTGDLFHVFETSVGPSVTDRFTVLFPQKSPIQTE